MEDAQHFGNDTAEEITMKAIAITDPLTGRIRRLRLTADTFDEERVLKIMLDGLVHDDTLFQLTRDGEPCGAFKFSGAKERKK